MSSRSELAALILLLRRSGRKRLQILERVEDDGSALPLLDEHYGGAELSLFDSNAGSVDNELDDVEAEIAGWEREGIQVLSVLDDGYPINLRTVYDRPPVLFLKGKLSAEDARSIAVVGTRAASEAGLSAARMAATGLVEADFTVFSGLAAGIDRAAHQATLDAGGRTIAVIGTGLRKAYPKENSELQEQLASKSAVVSQFWPDQPPTKFTFPMRNAVMSGISLATLVIEATGTSGARMQARLASEHGRPVFLMENLLTHDWARQYADRPGTYVVRDVQEVVEQVERITTYDDVLVA